MKSDLLKYDLGPGAESFTTMRDAALPCPVVIGHQVHGCRVAKVDRPDLTREDLEGYDALITNLQVAIGVRTADCIPVLLNDPVHRAVAAIHAGWKGTVGKIVLQTVSEMTSVYGTTPSQLKAVIGPGISFDSFQVGEEVVRIFRDNGFPMERIWRWNGSPQSGSMKGGHHIDLKSANRWLLEQTGIPASSIQVSEIDTYTDTRFFSARREGQQCGRNVNAVRIVAFENGGNCPGTILRVL